MDKHLEEEALMKKLMEELPMSSEMPPHVRTKVMNVAVEANRKAQSARRPRTVAWLTAGIAVVAAAAFMMPKPATAKTWSLVSQAVQKITSVQMDLQVKDKKHKIENVQIAMSGGQMLIRTGDEATVYFGNEGMQVYDKNTNTITKMKMPVQMTEFMPNMAEEMIGAFDLKKEITEMEAKYGRDHIKVMPFRQLDGRRVYDVVMTEPDGPGKAFLTVDANTDLPIFIDLNGSDKDEENVVINLRYNDNVTITPNFPKDAKIQSIDLSEMGVKFDGKEMGKMFDHIDIFGKPKK